MSGFLLDTNVLSEFNKPGGIPDQGVLQWLEVTTEPPVHCIGKGRPLPSTDSSLAATALTHDLVMVTRNVKDFEGIGVTILNPWKK